MIPAAACLTDNPSAFATGLIDSSARSFLIFQSLSPPKATCSDGIYPRTTFASVTVGSVPPLSYDAGPGAAPALCGPTLSAPVNSGT